MIALGIAKRKAGADLKIQTKYRFFEI